MINVLLAGSLATIIITIYSIENRKRGMDLFSPFSIFLIIFLFIFAIKPFEMIFSDNYDPTTLTLALIYIFIGLISFLVGYYLKIGTRMGKVIKPMPDNFGRNMMLIISVIMVVFGVILYFLILKMADIGGVVGAYTNMWRFRRIAFSQGMAYFTLLTQLFFDIPLTVWFIDLIERKKPGKAAWLFFCIYLTITVLILFTFGVRSMVIGVFLSLIICYQYLKRKISFLQLAVLALFFVLVFGFASAFRTAAMGEISLPEVMEASTAFSAQDYLNTILGRMDALPNFITVLERFPTQEMSFQFGRTFLNIFIQPIPRSLFQEKPYLIGDIFTQQFYPEDIGWASSDPSIFGELYMNLHVAGIVLGLLFLGVICRAFQVYQEKNKANKGVILFYAQVFGFPASLLGPGFGSSTTIYFIFCLVVVLSFLNLIKTKG